jgi:hypothetical protein
MLLQGVIMIEKLKKWLSAEKREQSIIDRIIERSKLCVYDHSSGRRFTLKLLVSYNTKYCPCSGRLLKNTPNVKVGLYIPADEVLHTGPSIKIHRNGKFSVMGNWKRTLLLKELPDGRKYIA